MKDDSRAIYWVLFSQFTSGASCVIGFASAVSATSALFYSSACSYWASGDILAGASVRVAIVSCVGPKDFIALTQYTAVSWDVDELYSTIFFNINGGTDA